MLNHMSNQDIFACLILWKSKQNFCFMVMNLCIIVGPEDEDGSLKRLTSPGDMSPHADYKVLYEEKVKQLEDLQGMLKIPY